MNSTARRRVLLSDGVHRSFSQNIVPRSSGFLSTLRAGLDLSALIRSLHNSAWDLEPNVFRGVTNLPETFGGTDETLTASHMCWPDGGYGCISTDQPAKSGPNNNAVNSPGQNNSNAPVAGRNSFTEGQAKSKIEEAGYTKVTDLKKDDNGVWRGKASKGGSATAVSVDFQGNVNPK